MFWDTFYDLCKKNNTTPNAVCASVGLSTATSTHWKNGVIPNLKTVSMLAEYFDVSIDYLLLSRKNLQMNKWNVLLNLLKP